MKKEACKAGLLVLAAAFAAGALRADEAAFARGESAAGRLDLREGTRLMTEGAAESIAYSPRWGAAASCTIDLGGSRSVATEEGVAVWTPSGAGVHTLTHTAGSAVYTAQFTVLADDVAVHGGALAAGETWGADNVHLVTAPLTVPSGVALAIESGAVVKFMPGASLTVESGGSCTAQGAIFTHVNDDTAGGDTLMDGDETEPKTGDYAITGVVTDDDATEYRYLPPQTLTSSISSDRRLRGYRTYIVSNSVTVASGATLTLQPGTILKFNTGCSLTVNGTLDAQGTRAAPIVFTSLKDDAHGGDTNSDGDKTYAQAGDWYQIRVSGTANFNHCHVLYNSSSENYGGIEAYGGTVNFDNSEIAHTKYECVNAHNSGYFTARNSIFRDSSLGFGYYGSGRVKAYNCVFADLTSGIRQSGKTLANCVFYRCLAFTDQSGDGSTFKNCVFFNPSGYGAQSYYKCGSNGNVWGDPLFADPDAGDFSIAANSPCVDAGDGSVAPEFDYWGKPRVGAPDIGIYEVAGANATGYDLAATAVAATTARFVVGDTIEASCTVVNAGRLAVADQWHDALYLVSSSSGKMYLLGEQLNPGGIGAGEPRTFSLRFALPVVPAGMYRLRLVANSRRMDVPEGAATENNVVVSEGEIEVAEEAVDAAKGASGSVAAGASAVCAFTMPSGSGDRLMRIVSTAGGAALSARGGLGFLPVDAASGMSLSFSGGTAWLSIPAGTEKVWLVLDNGGATAADYEVGFIDGSLTISGVSPSSIPSSGNITVEIAGAGFSDGCEVTFTGAGTVAPLSVKRVSQGLLAATVDAAAFAPCKTYSVAVKKSAETKTLADALSVAAPPGKAEFWAKLDVPDSMRQGRLMETCFIEYGNSGTADMPSPVLQVSMTGDGTLGYIGGLSGLKTLQFVAAGDAGSAGVLRPGSSHRIRFAIRAGASNRIALHTSEGSDYAPAPWTNAADYLADLSKAATRVGLRGQDATDYVRVFDLAKAVKNGEPSSAICGRVVDENGEAVEDMPIQFVDESTNTIAFVTTDAAGCFCTTNLAAETFTAIIGESLASSVAGALQTDGVSDLSLGDVSARCAKNFRVVVSGAADGNVAIVAADRATGEIRNPVFIGGTEAVFRGLPDGMYSIECCDSSGARLAECVAVCDGKSDDIAFRFGESGLLHVSADGLAEPEGCSLALFREGLLERIEDFDANGEVNLADVPTGDYLLVAWREDSDDAIPAIATIETGLRADVVMEASGRLENAKAKASSKSISLMKASVGSLDKEFKGEDSVRELLDAGSELLDMAQAMARPPEGAYDCDHNRKVSKNDHMRLVEYTTAYNLLVVSYNQYKNAKAYRAIKQGGAAVSILTSFLASATVAYYTPVIVGSGLSASAVEGFFGAVVTLVSEAASKFFATPQTAVGQWATIADLGDSLAGLTEALSKELMSNKAKEQLGKIAMKAPGWLTKTFSVGLHMIDGMDGSEMLAEREQILAKAYTRCYQKMFELEFDVAHNRFGRYHLCAEYDLPTMGSPVVIETPSVPKSWDPNEMAGPEGIGEARYVRPGQELTYTIYFENKEGFDIADAQEVRVTNPLCEWLDWSTFRMLEVAFNNQCDVSLDGLANGTSEVQMTGTNKYVRTAVECDAGSGVVEWYLRVYDPNGDSEGYPLDGSGFLPSNDETHRGEGHITYRVKVREDAPANVVITNSATIVFDYNDPIETDPAWWNTVAGVQTVEMHDGEGAVATQDLIVGLPYGDALPEIPVARVGYTFDGWFTGPNGTGRRVTPTSIVQPGDSGLYVQWISNAYTVTFDANGGTGTMADQPFVYGMAQKLSANAFTRKMYVFTGWARTADGSVVFADGQSVQNLTAYENDIVTLYAVWTKEQPLLWKDVSDAAHVDAASEYNGYLYDTSGAVAGTIQVKVGKPNAKTALASVKATVVGLDGKKKSLKAADGGKAVIASDGPTTVALAGGEACEVTLGAGGLAGFYGACAIDGARNFFTSKDKAEQSSANGILAPWLGAVNIVWDGGNVSVSIAKKGKAKAAIMLADGAKATANTQLLIGEEWLCVPVVAAKKANLAFALWLPRDGGEAIVEGLPDGAVAGKPGALGAGAKFRVDKSAALWSRIAGNVLADYLPDGMAVAQNGAKWSLPKAGKVAYIKKTTEVDPSKLGANPSALKLTYKAKDGSFKGSFKVYADVGGKLKATTANVSGVMVGGVGYGTATIKKLGSVPVTVGKE